MKPTMPERQKQILAYIAKFTSKHQYPPTVREIASACGFKAESAVQYHLNRLEDSGIISRDRNVARSIVIKEQVK